MGAEPTQLLELTNRVSADAKLVWAVAEKQHLGPFTPWPGTNTAQIQDDSQISLEPGDWRFFTYINEAGFANLTFLTFLPRVSGEGVPPEWIGKEPDLDLYVSMDSELTNLAPAALRAAWKSVSRRGTETIMLQDGTPSVYYIGVKTEAPVEAEFNLLVAARDEPFSRKEADGSILLWGFPLPGEISDATNGVPGMGYVLAVTSEPSNVDRLSVSNTVSHERFSDLRGWLAHDGVTVGLNQVPGSEIGGTNDYAWDDSGLGGMGAEHTDGPGSLLDFSGHPLAGQWLLTQDDVAPGAGGTNLEFIIAAYPSPEGAAFFELPPGSGEVRTVIVAANITNLTAKATLLAGDADVKLQLCRVGSPDNTCEYGMLTLESPSVEMRIDKFSSPPLNAGDYLLKVQNQGPELAAFQVETLFIADPYDRPAVRAGSREVIALLDNDTTHSTLRVTNSGRLVSVNAGVRIQHPRVSDLEVTLEAPDGTTTLLSTCRGGESIDGMGLDTTLTNTLPVSSSGGPLASTNVMDAGTGPGTVTIEFHFYSLPDRLSVYRGETQLFSSGMVSGSGEWTLAYGMDSSGLLTVVLNEGDNYDTNTAWDYVVTTTRPGMLLATFTEDTNLAAIPVKFAIPPFTNVTTTLQASNIIGYLPEQSLERFSGRMAGGDWRLHLLDKRAGPEPPQVQPTLFGWDLYFVMEDPLPLPIPLSHAAARTSMLRAHQWNLYTVDAPAWAERATNQLLFSSAPVNVWFSETGPPLGTNSGDVLLLENVFSGVRVLTQGESPALHPGSRYFLAVQNSNNFAVNISLAAAFDVAPLEPGQCTPLLVSTNAGAKFFKFEVSANAGAVFLELTNVTGNPDLVLGRGNFLPSLDSYDYTSQNADSEPERIVVSRRSSPVPLSPGVWYLGVINASLDGDASGDLCLSESDGRPVRITRVAATPDSIRLEWQGDPRSRYEVQWTSELSPPGWISRPGFVTSDTGNFVFEEMPPESAARFYRVIPVW